MPEAATIGQEKDALRVFPVSLESLDPHVLSMDLYLKPARGSYPVLYRAVGVEFSEEDRQRLFQKGVQFLYVPVHQHAKYREAMVARLDSLFRDPEQGRAERVRMIRAACEKMIEDVLLFPDQPEAVSAVTDIGAQFAKWAGEDSAEFSYLLDMSAHDYYTVTHMVNVGVGCGLLVQALRPGDEELLSRCVQGGMLHDVGKKGIAQNILNKEGPLSPEEFKKIKQHPGLAFDVLHRHPSTSPTVLEMARDHHERIDGTGYPGGKSGEQIGLAARVCAVVDVYDAITSKRPYRGPTPPTETLRILHEGRGTHFDVEALDAWTKLVEALLAADPERAPETNGPPADLTLDVLLPRGEEKKKPDPVPVSEGRIAMNLYSDEQRRHPRFKCDREVKVRPLRTGKPLPIPNGEFVTVRMADFSRGGMQLRTPWPLSLNDTLEVELQMQNGSLLKHTVRVVRMRAVSNHEWAAGVQFI